MHVICDSCDEIDFYRIFDPDATVEHPYDLFDIFIFDCIFFRNYLNIQII